MRWPIIFRHIGIFLLFDGFFLFFAGLISIYNGENSAIPLFYSALIAVFFGVFPLIYVPRPEDLNAGEGIVIVVFSWVLTCLLGTLPYILWGGEFSFTNAWFESVSGFTTTGSTVLINIEAIPKGLLFWRSATHWIGGVGIILFVLLILPTTSQSKVVLFNIEMSSIAKENFAARMNEIVRILLVVYVGLTLSEVLLLWIFGMDLFDAVNHAFATIATGGFSTKNASIAHFDSLSIEIIIMLFMVLSGIHFGLIFLTIQRKKMNIFTSLVVRYYVLSMLGGILLVSFKLMMENYGPWWISFRAASFQVISLGTTTGFATVDTANWPYFTQLILLFFTIQCACAGSTSGGMKVDRVIIFFKSLSNRLKRLQYPRGVFTVRINGRALSEDLVDSVLVFIITYLFIVTLTALALTGMDVDIFSAFSASAATMGNVGPGFGTVSSLGNFSNIPDPGKYLLSVNMLLGRLEIFGLMTLFFVRFWK